MDVKQVQAKIYSDFQKILADDRLSHAYLFEGYFGSFDLAIWLAKSRFCQQTVQGLPCEQCRTCRLIEQQEFSDLHVVEPSGQVLKTETIRDLLQDFSRSGFEGTQQVFIICGTERMHPNASNRLLKVIEEPQPGLYIFLLTDDSSKVLSTIKSRCQLVTFIKNESYLIDFLERDGLLKEQAELVAKLAQDEAEAKKLSSNQKFLGQLHIWDSFVDKLLFQPDRAFLEVARLTSLCLEKQEQEYGLNLLVLLLAKRRDEARVSDCLDRLQLAYEMWRSHVSFQSVLEYMIIN